MGLQSAKNLKKELMETPDNYFEPLTFGELGLGKKFICLPSPGDNHSHGGLRIAHWLFEKTQNMIEEVKPGIPYSKDHPHGMATNVTNKTESTFSLSMHIILVE